MQYFLTFLEGIISFISPCMLPMLPIYVSYFAGGSGDRKKTFIRILFFVLGFTVVFTLIGGIFAGVMSTLKGQYRTVLNVVTGIVVVLFGLSYLDVIHLPFFKGLKGTKNVGTAFSAFVFGVVYSVSLSPCVGAFLGSALMMLVSIYGFGGEADASRVAAQIVSGVGFLGAGIIVYRKHETKGLTTAAGVWATAGVGMACGGGLYILAVVATTLMITAQVLFHTNFRLFKQKSKFTIEIVFYQTEDENILIKKEFDVDRFNSLLITRQNERLIYSATLLTEREHRSAELTKIMQDNPFIISLRRCDD